MCLKINARPFHPFPETTDKKNSSDVVWLQNWENQALNMIFNLFNKIQSLSRGGQKTPKTKDNQARKATLQSNIMYRFYNFFTNIAV